MEDNESTESSGEDSPTLADFLGYIAFFEEKRLSPETNVMPGSYEVLHYIDPSSGLSIFRLISVSPEDEVQWQTELEVSALGAGRHILRARDKSTAFLLPSDYDPIIKNMDTWKRRTN